MLKSNRLGDIEIPSLQNYSIAVRGAATPVLALLGGRSPQIRVRCWHVPVTQSSAFEHPVVLAVGTAAGGASDPSATAAVMVMTDGVI